MLPMDKFRRYSTWAACSRRICWLALTPHLLLLLASSASNGSLFSLYGSRLWRLTPDSVYLFIFQNWVFNCWCTIWSFWRTVILRQSGCSHCKNKVLTADGTKIVFDLIFDRDQWAMWLSVEYVRLSRMALKSASLSFSHVKCLLRSSR